MKYFYINPYLEQPSNKSIKYILGACRCPSFRLLFPHPLGFVDLLSDIITAIYLYIRCRCVRKLPLSQTQSHRIVLPLLLLHSCIELIKQRNAA